MADILVNRLLKLPEFVQETWLRIGKTYVSSDVDYYVIGYLMNEYEFVTGIVCRKILVDGQLGQKIITYKVKVKS